VTRPFLITAPDFQMPRHPQVFIITRRMLFSRRLSNDEKKSAKLRDFSMKALTFLINKLKIAKSVQKTSITAKPINIFHQERELT